MIRDGWHIFKMILPEDGAKLTIAFKDNTVRIRSGGDMDHAAWKPMQLEVLNDDVTAEIYVELDL